MGAVENSTSSSSIGEMTENSLGQLLSGTFTMRVETVVRETFSENTVAAAAAFAGITGANAAYYFTKGKEIKSEVRWGFLGDFQPSNLSTPTEEVPPYLDRDAKNVVCFPCLGLHGVIEGYEELAKEIEERARQAIEERIQDGKGCEQRVESTQLFKIVEIEQQPQVGRFRSLLNRINGNGHQQTRLHLENGHTFLLEPVQDEQ